jgi:predicted nucleic acid-binding protein
MRVVVDANVLASGIFWGGYPNRILDRWAYDRMAVLVSIPILDEYSRVLTVLGQREERTDLAGRWIAFIRQYSICVDVQSTVPCRPIPVCACPAGHALIDSEPVCKNTPG